ncbi:MAG: glycerophosphodiester phosphodiesterase [Alkalispirochaeta sp.]
MHLSSIGFRLTTVMIIASITMLAACVSPSRDSSQGNDGGETAEPEIPVEPRSYIFVQAHRGSTTDYPELTLAAFDAALEAGVDRIEMDLAITADDEVVLMHDISVDRTTDGSGRVESFTLEELKQLDAGSWHSERFADERVPTLREVIEIVDGRAELNLEVKTKRRSGLLVNRIIEETVSLVEEMGAEDQVLYSSFEVDALLEVRERDPEARLLLLDWLPGASYDGITKAVDNNLYAWSPSAEHITEERVQQARRAGLSTHVGAAPGRRAREYIEWGIDGLSSGNPVELVQFLEREGYR